jgi:predicted RNase H-like HicB family nuclease
MKEISFVVWREDKYYVSQCLNVEVSSFGESIDEAVANLKEAVELYFEDENLEFLEIDSVIVGKEKVHA